MTDILGKDSKVESNIFTMDLDDELCLKPVPESFDDKCDIIEDVLKDVDENEEIPFISRKYYYGICCHGLLILSFSISFSLSNESLLQLLMLFYLLLLYNTKLCKTIYQFREDFMKTCL